MKNTAFDLPALHAAVTAVACAADPAAPTVRFSHILLAPGACGAFNGVLRAYEPCAALVPPQPCWLPGALLQAALAAALAQGGKAPAIAYTSTHVLIAAGGFKARLPVLQAPEGVGPLGIEPGEFDIAAVARPGAAQQKRLEALYAAITALLPIIALGRSGGLAAMPWAQGLYIASGAVYAAQNIAVGRYTLPSALPGWPPAGLTLPAAACEELLRRGAPPQALAPIVGPEGIPAACIAHYANGGALTTALVPGPWPASVEALFAPVPPLKRGEYAALPEALAAAVTALCPFAPAGAPPIVHFRPGGALAVIGAEGQEIASQVVPGAGALCGGAFRADALAHALALARRAAWGRYPRVYWDGGAESPLAGVFIGTNA
jgi:hypothetical protein